jgi:hypothetical protein
MDYSSVTSSGIIILQYEIIVKKCLRLNFECYFADSKTVVERLFVCDVDINC